MIKTAYVTPDWSRAVIGNLVYTRVEIIEEQKAKIDQLLRLTRSFRDLCRENSPEWLAFDTQIDKLLSIKDKIHLPEFDPREYYEQIQG